MNRPMPMSIWSSSGGGIAGLTAALDAARAGKSVWVLEQSSNLGAVARRADHADGLASHRRPCWRNCAPSPRHPAPQHHGDRAFTIISYLLAREALADHDPNAGIPRQRLWRIRRACDRRHRRAGTPC